MKKKKETRGGTRQGYSAVKYQNLSINGTLNVKYGLYGKYTGVVMFFGVM